MHYFPVIARSYLLASSLLIACGPAQFSGAAAKAGNSAAGGKTSDNATATPNAQMPKAPVAPPAASPAASSAADVNSSVDSNANKSSVTNANTDLNSASPEPSAPAPAPASPEVSTAAPASGCFQVSGPLWSSTATATVKVTLSVFDDSASNPKCQSGYGSAGLTKDLASSAVNLHLVAYGATNAYLGGDGANPNGGFTGCELSNDSAPSLTYEPSVDVPLPQGSALALPLTQTVTVRLPNDGNVNALIFRVCDVAVSQPSGISSDNCYFGGVEAIDEEPKSTTWPVTNVIQSALPRLVCTSSTDCTVDTTTYDTNQNTAVSVSALGDQPLSLAIKLSSCWQPAFFMVSGN